MDGRAHGARLVHIDARLRDRPRDTRARRVRHLSGGPRSGSEWFPRRERALAIGIFNAGANLGAIITPMIVPLIALAMGWRSAFVVTGLFNIIWIAAWLVFYRRPRDHQRLSKAELAYIESDLVEPRSRSHGGAC